MSNGMFYVLTGVLILLGSFCSLCYMTWVNQTRGMEDERFNFRQIVTAWPRVPFMTIVMLVCSMALAIGLRMIYTEQSTFLQIQNLSLILLLFPIAWQDYYEKKIPNVLIVTGIFIRIIFYVVHLLTDAQTLFTTIKSDILACLILGAFMVLLRLIFKNGIGMGDIKLFLVMGFYQGLQAVTSSIFFSIVIAWFIAVFLLITRKKSRKDSIPFGPAILIGTYLSLWLTGV